jgi:hypothetical protein
MQKESDFQAEVIKDIRDMFPGCIILKNDPNYLQGFPDLTIFFEDKWAILETKIGINARRRPNQQYYVETARKMSYASFIYPENKELVYDELQFTFRPSRRTRLSKR